MCRILNLPPEVVVWVFESLDNIDDALHLARCCKYAFSVFDATSVRLKIFRPIHHRKNTTSAERDLVIV
jgi:hypothetical protein